MAAKGRVLHAAFRTFGGQHGTGPYPTRHSKHNSQAASSATELVEGWHERKQCNRCRAPYHREKETDVNLAVDLVDGAHRDKYDVAMVISADSDFVPAMERVRTVTKIRDGIPAQKRVVWGHFPHQAHVKRIERASGETFLLTDKLLRTCKRLNRNRPDK